MRIFLKMKNEKRGKIYLAGSFFDFRDKIIQALPDNNFDNPRNNRQFCISALVEDDMTKAIGDKILLACFPKGKTRGTATYAEIGASRISGNYIIIADENQDKDPLLRTFADINLDSIDEAIGFLKDNRNKVLKSNYERIQGKKEFGKVENIFFAGNEDHLKKLDLNKLIYFYDDSNPQYSLSIFKNFDLTLAHFPEAGDWSRKQIFFMGVSYALKIPVIMLDEKEVPYPPLNGLVRRVFRTKRSLVDYLDSLESQKVEDEAKVMYNLFKKYDNI